MLNFVSGMNVVTEVVHLVSSSTVRVPFLESLEAPILQCRFKYVKPKVATLVKFHPDFHYRIVATRSKFFIMSTEFDKNISD